MATFIKKPRTNDLALSKHNKFKNILRKIGNTFLGKKIIEFCKKTDFHGYKYISMKDLTFIERSCWLVVVIVSIFMAIYFVVTAYKWYARNPIITVIESTHGPIWDVPFPAVTICDLNLVSRKEAIKFSENVRLPENITRKELFESLQIAPILLTLYKVHQNQIAALETLQNVIDYNNISMKTFITTLSPASSCSDVIERCMWKNSLYRCELLFRQIITQFSVCCTFNYYAMDVLHDAMLNELFEPEVPRRVASCGYQTGLTVLLNSDPNDYYSSILASYGLLLFIDNAYNVPNLNSPVRLISPSTEVFIALSPETTYATYGIRLFQSSERQCNFNDEIKLKNFAKYSYHNCLIYETVKATLEKCGCVPIFYSDSDNDERICNYQDITCTQDVNDLIKKKPLNVSCLPDCEHFDYPLEVAVGMLSTDKSVNKLTFFKSAELTNRSLLNVFFNDLVMTKYRRDVYMNWQNLLASFGGLLSLMLGFTMISAVDFILFFAFKLPHDLVGSLSTIENDQDENIKK